MEKPKMISNCFIVLLSIMMVSCARPSPTRDGGMGAPLILAKPSYLIDVYFVNQPIDRKYSIIGPVKVEKEVPLDAGQTSKDGRMVDRGNTQDQKKELLEQLMLQGISMGATGLVNVKYTYYTTKSYQGYTYEGFAVKWE